MPDMDKSERLAYLEEELRKQREKLDFHKKHIEALEDSIKFQKGEIEYNEGWVRFHKDSMLRHENQVKDSRDGSEKEDQIRKLAFHEGQIRNHHNACIAYHQGELSYALKWVQLNKEALEECNVRIKFLEGRIRDL